MCHCFLQGKCQNGSALPSLRGQPFWSAPKICSGRYILSSSLEKFLFIRNASSPVIVRFFGSNPIHFLSFCLLLVVSLFCSFSHCYGSPHSSQSTDSVLILYHSLTCHLQLPSSRSVQMEAHISPSSPPAGSDPFSAHGDLCLRTSEGRSCHPHILRCRKPREALRDKADRNSLILLHGCSPVPEPSVLSGLL